MTRSSTLLIAFAVVAAACTVSGPAAPEGGGTVDGGTVAPPSSAASASSHAGTLPAPDFPLGLDWINTAGPVTLSSLRGKVVLLDFWTYGCINCIHIIPDLKRLEAEYPDELVVIGVHSAKFANESATENIRSVVKRYEVEHPVVNDADFAVWRTWGASAWPTVALIDPAGNVVGTHAGEGVYDIVQPIVASLVEEFQATNELDTTPLSFRPESRDNTILSFPGKVLADPDSDRLFIADSGNHRIVVVDGNGTVEAVYGDGTTGFTDEPSTAARFHAPQGMALDDTGTVLFVADTNNHAVREIDLRSGNVSTLAGTGAIGWPPREGPFDEVALNSPWGITRSGRALLVANAGTHQIWSLSLDDGIATPLVGSAREGTGNGPLEEAELAQPSGLTVGADGLLYFADSESSSIRSADLSPGGITALVAGGSANLFEFGDEDGTGPSARFQHPLGIASYRDSLLVADTYNSKIKLIDLETREATTFAGGDQGWADGATPRFAEPGGLSIRGDMLFVADTNNHVVRTVDLATGETSTIVIKGIERFLGSAAADYSGTVITVHPPLLPAGPASLVLQVALPPDYKVNEEAPSSLSLTITGPAAEAPGGAFYDLTGTRFPVEIPLLLAPGEGKMLADLTLIYCREDAEGLCLIEQVRFDVTVAVTESGPSAVIPLEHSIVLEDV